MLYEYIKPYIKAGLVSEQSHPEWPDLRIFNYTQKCQFEQVWDDITRQCRGLIMDVGTGKIIARPFPKFFNYGEHVTKGWAIPAGRPIVTEKLDGSLGIMYTLNGKTWIATRGSFTSDQAMWATKWWRENKGDEPYGNDVTHLFEIIYPENRIVVNYDFSGLVHLTSLETATGLPITDSRAIMPVRKAAEVPYTDMETLQKMDTQNSEGFVLYYPDDNIRMKIKFPEYIRLHKLVTGVSEIAIWEHLRDGKGLGDLIEKVPDEFYQWVTQVSNRLNNQFNAIREQAERDYNDVIRTVPWYDENRNRDRKEIALKFQKKENPGILFAILDDKPTAPMIWRMLRPHGQKQFKIDIDL